jgi:hypothetical protein
MTEPGSNGESMWAKLKKLNVEIKMPKRDGAKAKAPKAEPYDAEAKEVKAEAPKAEAPKAKAPKVKTPKVAAAKAKAPRIKVPKLKMPNLMPPDRKSVADGAPDVKAAKAEAPKTKAPRIKTPEISLPPAIAGVVDNLRDRGLLPVAGLLVAAIVAVPFLLSGGSSSPPPPKTDATAAAAADAIETQQAVVLAGNPGVREYKKRLNNSHSDPFVQQYQAPASGGGDASTAVVQTGSDPGVEPTNTGTAPSGGTTTNTGTKTHHLYYYAADLYVGVAGKKLKLWPDVKRGITIPNDNVPAVSFLGVPVDSPGSALFAISDDVVEVSGTGHCELGDHGCELVRVKIGNTLKFTYVNGVTYAVKLAGTHRVTPKS